MEIGESQTRAAVAHRATVEITTFLEKELFPRVSEKLRNPEEFGQVVCGLYARLFLLAKTLCQLPDSSHFQTVRSSSRTAFEVMVDLKELAANRSLAAKVVAHGYASRYRNARRTVEALRKHDRVPPERYRHEFTLSDDPVEQKRFKDLCHTHWERKDGKVKLPDNWSGKDIASRARALGPEYEELYCKVYAVDCAVVHSSITMVWGFPAEFFHNAFAVGHMNFQKFLLRSTASVCEACDLRPDPASFGELLKSLELHTGKLLLEAIG